MIIICMFEDETGSYDPHYSYIICIVPTDHCDCFCYISLVWISITKACSALSHSFVFFSLLSINGLIYFICDRTHMTRTSSSESSMKMMMMSNNTVEMDSNNNNNHY